MSVGCETLVRREKERFRRKAPQIHNLAGLLGIERRGKILNGRDREVCREKKGWRTGLMKVVSGRLNILKEHGT